MGRQDSGGRIFVEGQVPDLICGKSECKHTFSDDELMVEIVKITILNMFAVSSSHRRPIYSRYAEAETADILKLRPIYSRYPEEESTREFSDH